MQNRYKNAERLQERYRNSGILLGEEKLETMFNLDTLDTLSRKRLSTMQGELMKLNLSGLNKDELDLHEQRLKSVQIILRQKAHNCPDMDIPELQRYIAKHSALLNQAVAEKNMEEQKLHLQYRDNAGQALYVLQQREANSEGLSDDLMAEGKKLKAELIRKKAEAEQKALEDAERQFAEMEAPALAAKTATQNYRNALFTKIIEMQIEATNLITTRELVGESLQKAADRLTELSATAGFLAEDAATNNSPMTPELDKTIYGALQEFIGSLQPVVEAVIIHTSESDAEEKVPNVNANHDAAEILRLRKEKEAADAAAKAAKAKAAESMAPKWNAYKNPQGNRPERSTFSVSGSMFGSSFPENKLTQTRNWNITPVPVQLKKTDAVCVIKDNINGKTLTPAQTRTTEIELSENFQIRKKSF